MIGRFEISQASTNHVADTATVSECCLKLGIDQDCMDAMIEAMLLHRKPEELARSKRSAYIAGMLDGFFLGVKAHYAESFVICEQCGAPVPRKDNDPVPKDYSPLKHCMICESCVLSNMAALN